MGSGKKQARAIEAAANQQAEATRQSAEAASRAARESAAQAQRQIEQNAARNAAVGVASEALAVPLENADVQLEATNAGASVAGTARKRRASFGLGTASSGVNI